MRSPDDKRNLSSGMSLYAEQQADFETILAEFEEFFYFKGHRLRCHRAESTTRRGHIDGGFADSFDLTLICNTESFGSLGRPQSGSTITFSGAGYRVIQTRLHAGGALFELDLESATK